MIAVCSVNAAARRYAGGGFVLHGKALVVK